MMEHSVTVPLNDLPYWMRQARRGRDWGALLVLAFSLIAAWPMLGQSGLPQAAENYVYMTADYSDSLRQGWLYPRWSPNALGGYGAPIPNFFPPAAPYSAALVKTLFTDDAVLAVRAIFAAAFVVAGLGTYAFVRRHSSAAAGLFAALLYVYSPYFGYTLPYVRGDLVLVVALALVPAFLWTLDRLLADNRAQDLLLCTSACAALMLADPAIAIIALSIGLILVVVDHGVQPASWSRVALSAGLGIGLTAFYWLPALLESSQVYWLPNTPAPTLLLDNLLTPLQPADPAALIPLTQLTLGITLPLLVLVALFAAIRKQAWFHLTFFLAGIAALLLGVFVIPQAHWLLGIGSLCLAVAATAVLQLLQHLSQWGRFAAQTLLFGIALASGLNNLTTPAFSALTFNAEPISQLLYEQQRFGIAILQPEAVLPSPFLDIPQANRLLLSGYENNNINKIVPVQASNNARINLISHQQQRDRFQITSQSTLNLNLLTAYYPGWTATAAGQPIDIYPDPQTGLIALTLPPMNGELVFEFGSTPARLAAWLLSLSALATLLMLTWRRFHQDSGYSPETNLLTRIEGLWGGAVLVSFAAVALLFALPNAPFSLEPEPGQALTNARSLRHRSEVGLEALAYALSAEELRPGDTLRVTLYWRTITPLAANYQSRLALRDVETGAALVTTDYRAPGYYPTSRWRSFLYVSDNYTLTLPADTPPGDYQVSIEVSNCTLDCDEALTFFTAAGRNIDQLSYLDTTIHVQN